VRISPDFFPNHKDEQPVLLKENSKEFQRPKLGIDSARCIAVVDLGTQHGEYQGKPKSSRQVIFRFELPNQLIEEGEYAGQPLTVWSRRFSQGLSEKSALRPFLEAWRGAKFTKEELEGFDPKKILGRTCLLTMGEESKNGKTYSQILAISGVPNGTVVPKQVNPAVYVDLDAFDQAAFDGLPEWVRKLIDGSDERNGVKATAAAPKSNEPVEEDIPF
jgi:hypothetical protein